MPFKIIDNTQHLQNCFGKAPNFNSSSYEKPNLSYLAKPTLNFELFFGFPQYQLMSQVYNSLPSSHILITMTKAYQG
jgi:hypothetical protein